MANKHWAVACCAGLILGLPVPALASKCEDVAADNPSLNQEHLVKKLKNQGYKLRSLKPQCHIFVVQAWDRDGQYVLMHVHAKTGDILEQQKLEREQSRWLPVLDMFDEER